MLYQYHTKTKYPEVRGEGLGSKGEKLPIKDNPIKKKKKM